MTIFEHPQGLHFRCCILDQNGDHCTHTCADGLELGRHLKDDHPGQYASNRWRFVFRYYGLVAPATAQTMKAARKDHGVKYDKTWVAPPAAETWARGVIIDQSSEGRAVVKPKNAQNWLDADRQENAIMDLYTPLSVPAVPAVPVATAAATNQAAGALPNTTTATAATNQPARRYPARDRRAPARYIR